MGGRAGWQPHHGGGAEEAEAQGRPPLSQKLVSQNLPPGGPETGAGDLVVFLLALAPDLRRVQGREGPQNSGNLSVGSEAVLCRAQGSQMRREGGPEC